MENRTHKTQRLDALSPFKTDPSATGPEVDLADPLNLMNVRLADIVLTDEEKADALREALNAKRHKISLERTRTMEKIRAIDNQVKGPQTPMALWDTVIGRGVEMAQKEEWEHPFQIPDFSYDIFQALCYYFTKDREGMMHYHLSPHKGLMLFGPVGVGKSVIMKLFARNVLQSYQVIKCAAIETEYAQKDNASATIQKYSVMKLNEYRSIYYNQTELGYCFDDLGAEEVANNYGKKDIMISILEARYDNCKGPKTHLTTNSTLDQIEKRYGIRVLDRMRQMFNLVEFPTDTESLRA